MRQELKLIDGWRFTGPDGKTIDVSLPHTWNAQDGADGGNDYFRGVCTYLKHFPAPDFDPEQQDVYLEFKGVNSSARVTLNGTAVCRHDGGYSTFRANVTSLLRSENQLHVAVDNTVNHRVYPQKADFTFYGGIYRDVLLRIVPKERFDLDYCGGEGIKISSRQENGTGLVRVECRHNAPGAMVHVALLNHAGHPVAEGTGDDGTLTIPGVRLWDGVRDPYLYTASLRLERDGQVLDQISIPFGVRSFSFDPDKGFFLNGRPYPLRGVSRHQDWKGLGNAITPQQHLTDMALIREVGANTIRLAHYQHDPYFYDLCDRYGMIVWAEIPYISQHMPSARQNTLEQMEELIIQNYNHPSIVMWGISNEITISTKDTDDMLENHRLLNDLCHRLDPTRPTTLACYALCSPFHKVVHVTDLVGYNLYLGWYIPGLVLNDWFMDFFHRKWPRRCLGYSEYGAEGMPNLHSSVPRRGDHTEEYQAEYHEYMLKCFARHPYLWGTYVWNMFDFAADARDQGGEPGMNHKGLVSFDRKIKKDSFYLYKAWWSQEPFVHICSRRFVDRCEKKITIKVYSNQTEVSLLVNGHLARRSTGDKVFTFHIPIPNEIHVQAVAGNCTDSAVFRKVETPNLSYQLQKNRRRSKNWI